MALNPLLVQHRPKSRDLLPPKEDKPQSQTHVTNQWQYDTQKKTTENVQQPQRTSTKTSTYFDQVTIHLSWPFFLQAPDGPNVLVAPFGFSRPRPPGPPALGAAVRGENSELGPCERHLNFFENGRFQGREVFFRSKKTQKNQQTCFLLVFLCFLPFERGMQRYVASFKVEGMFHLWTNTHPPFWRMTVMEWSHLRWLRSEEISHFPWWIIDAFLLLRCHAKLSKQSALIRFFLWAQLASGFC